jgi:amino acid adenylation domain-containing protein
MDSTASTSHLNSAAQRQLLTQWNDTAVSYPTDQCLHQLFEAQVEQTPDAIALVFEAQHLTYAELNRRANQLAHHLQGLGVQPDTLVGLCVERSLEMVIGLFGILKAGGAYVPLDPAYPQERLAFMLADTAASVLLTQHNLVESLPQSKATIVCLDRDWNAIAQFSQDNPVCTATPFNLAYAIYTSGSTGKPKGVLIQHQSACNYMCWMQSAFPLDSTDKVLQKTPLSFDASVWEFYTPLLAGAQLVLSRPDGHKDVSYLIDLILAKQITILQAVPTLLQALLEQPRMSSCRSLKRMFCGGEALTYSLTTKFFATLDAALINLYGPTEACIYSTSWECDRASTQPIVPIGRPIANTQTYILDPELKPVAIGELGELHIGGDGLARGYHNRPELTSQKFIPNPFSSEPSPRLYKTGDLARYLPDGKIEFLGRIDYQVKIRGFRIELGEIEAALLSYPSVQQTVVMAREDQPGNQRLVAYLVVNGQPPRTSELRRYLLERMPDYAVPSAFITLAAMPVMPNDKINRRALPAPTNDRPDLEQSYVAPKGELARSLATIWSRVLNIEPVGVNDNFFELGGSSLLSLQVITQIQQELGVELPAVKFFQYPTIAELATYLEAGQSTSSYDRFYQRAQRRRGRSLTNDSTQATDGVAIIGMAGRFPGANTIEQLWQNLCNGVESTTFFTDAELDPNIDPALRQEPNYIKARGIVDDADRFDAAFFGVNPREAEVTDPQQRVFMELAWAALETAGYDPETFPGLIGVYAGAGNNTYFVNNLIPNPKVIERFGYLPVVTVNEKDYLATRVSYKLNLKGPSVNVNTACSTSLVAINEAFHSLMDDRCDLAIAGGVSIDVPQNVGYLYQEGAMFSNDGHCRPFDAESAGTIFGNGAGIVVLKRLAEALEAGDHIYAVIRGAATNNDGSGKVSFTAPSVEGQAGAIVLAQAYADIDPATISYVEAHGTATPLGDPIEVEALTQAFRTRTQAKQFCAIGSIKSNFGHAIAAAGVAGVIKTALALQHKLLPPSLFFAAPNPNIDFASSPFYVNAELTEWQAGETPRRAGVSSFGVGGTNAHVILEEAPAIVPSSESRPRQLLLLSAKTESALATATANLHQHLSDHADVNLADVAHTLQVGRRGFNHRRLVVCRDRTNALQALETLPPQQTATRQTESRDRDVMFLFPGQGSQSVNMGLNLYTTEPVFRATIDQCATILEPLLGRDLRQVLYPKAGGEDAAAEILRNTFFTQPALFAVEYALAQLWRSWGVQPAGMIGHSIGEFVAACLAGVFSLEDALLLVATRGRLMQALPGGSMLSVRQSAAEVEPRLTGELAIAAVNAPGLCVVSGPTDQVTQFQQLLEAEEILCKPLFTSHAFHSPMMDAIVEPFAETVRTVQLHPPKLPIVSTVTATWMTPAQATDPMYWANHLRATVRFANGIATLWEQPDRILLEVGPRTTAATMARRQAKNLKQQIAISSLGDSAADNAEWDALLNAVGQLWLAGVTIAWSDFYAHETRHRLPLPTYPFERKRFWIDPPAKPFGIVDMPVSESTAIEPAIESPEIAQANPLPTQPELQAVPISPALVQPEPQASQPIPEFNPVGVSMSQSTVSTQPSRQQTLIPQLREVLEDTSGLELEEMDETTTFLEVGLDSLSLTQVGLALQRQFKVKVTFRQLMESFPTLGTLATFIDQQLPPEVVKAVVKVEPAPQVQPAQAVNSIAAPLIAAPTIAPPPIAAPTIATLPTPPVETTPAVQVAATPAPIISAPITPTPAPAMTPLPQPIPLQPMPAIASSGLESVVAQQIQLMSRQLELLAGSGLAVAPMQPTVVAMPETPTSAPTPAAPQPQLMPAPEVKPAPEIMTTAPTNGSNGVKSTNGAATQPTIAPANETLPKEEKPKAFGAIARIDTSESTGLTPQQQENLDKFIQQYTTRTQKSKQYTQHHRSHLADPRAVSGFNRTMKEMVYPIVSAGASGTKIWDIDGNEYIDLNNAFGANFFGYSAPYINAAIAAQLETGYEIGPQTPLAGEVAALFCEMTHMERAAFCNTGSEAVLGAMRLARTVTGRNTIAMFTGAYHGILDEVIVRGTKKLKSVPAAPGIPASAVENMLVLDYDAPDALEILRQRGDELAAIMVEPVQSRRPDYQPKELLHQLRHLTEQCGAAFIVDEVITGFRMHPAGAQGYFGVQADLASYGKVVGAGMPIGVLAGKATFMDALDGGSWQFGDESFPEIGVTYFAGTFVRHPLGLAAAKAALTYLKQQGPELQRSLNQKADQFTTALNTIFNQAGVPYKIKHFCSLMKIVYPSDLQFGELLFYWLRHKGIHIWDNRTTFLTLAHTDADLEFVLSTFKQSIAEMQAAGFLPGSSNGHSPATAQVNPHAAPVLGARLGRDPQGNPAWYVPDPDRPGKFLQVNATASR